MFGTKPEKAGWAEWQPSVDRPAKRRANAVTAKARGRPGDGKNHLGSGSNVNIEEKRDNGCQDILLWTRAI